MEVFEGPITGKESARVDTKTSFMIGCELTTFFHGPMPIASPRTRTSILHFSMRPLSINQHGIID